MIQEKILIPYFSEALEATYTFLDSGQSDCILLSIQGEYQQELLDLLVKGLTEVNQASLLFCRETIELKQLITCLEDIYLQPNFSSSLQVLELGTNYLSELSGLADYPVLKHLKRHTSYSQLKNEKDVSICLKHLLNHSF